MSLSQKDIDFTAELADIMVKQTHGDPERIAKMLGAMVAYFCYPHPNKPHVDGKAFGDELNEDLAGAGQ